MSTIAAEDLYSSIPATIERLANEINEHLIDSRLDQLTAQIREKFDQFADVTDLNSKYLDRVTDVELKDSIRKGLDNFSQSMREAVINAGTEADDLLRARKLIDGVLRIGGKAAGVVMTAVDGYEAYQSGDAVDMGKIATGAVLAALGASIGAAFGVAIAGVIGGAAAAIAAPVIGTLIGVAVLGAFVNDILAEIFPEFYEGLGNLIFEVVEGINNLYEMASESFGDFLNWWDPLGINEDVNADFNAARNFVQQRRDPLTLDLDGDGIETISANTGIVFDFDGDGLKTGTGWVKGDDGFLVLDRNGNGSIDTGRELFGVDTVKANGQKASDGFDALRDLDGNADGVFDAQDAQFANVRVWQDANQDGVAQANELKSLAEHDISAINLDSTATSQNSNGNLISATGIFVRSDGAEGSINDNQSLAANLDLASNPFYREHTDSIELDSAAQALPDMQGSGAVRDLREAAMLDAGLKSVLNQYSQAQTREQQMALLDKLLAEWASSSSYKTWDQRIGNLGHDMLEVSFAYSWERPDTDSIISFSTDWSSGEQGTAAEDSGPTAAQLAQKQVLERIKILEIFNGQNFFNFSRSTSSSDSDPDAISTFNLSSGSTTGSKSMAASARVVVLTEEDLTINAGQAALLNQAYDALLQSVYNGLLVQTRLQPYFDVVGLELTETGIALDFSASQQLFQQNAEQNPVDAMLDLADFMSHMKFTGKDMLNWGTFTDTMFSTLNEADSVEFQRQLTLLPSSAETARFGTAGIDNLKGGATADTFFAGAGNDTLDGGTGSNTLYGEAGDDILKVTATSSSNLLSGGAGNDSLTGGYYNDTYLFNLGDGVDTITEMVSGSSYTYTDVLRFGEGIAASDIQTQRVGLDLVFAHSNGTDKVVLKNVFTGSSATANYVSANVIEKVEFADDTVWTWAQMMQDGIEQVGTAVGETIIGWAGKDIIHGGAGNDTLDGGTGSNTLYGEAGDDILKVTATSSSNLLSGGAGNDSLTGGYYNDTYLFNLGDGVDTITEMVGSSSTVYTDVLRFGADLSPEQLWFQRNGNNLDILVEGSSDRVTVSNWYASSGSRIEQMQSSDGLALTESRVQNLVDAMAAFGAPAGGESNLTPDQREQLNVVIAANWQ